MHRPMRQLPRHRTRVLIGVGGNAPPSPPSKDGVMLLYYTPVVGTVGLEPTRPTANAF